jgi:hypothetical protein
VFDLTVFTFNRLTGTEVPELPGSFAAAPPKRPARGRERDRLVLLLQFEERGPVTQGAQKYVLEKLATVFYSTRGTVTTALKAVVEQMNERLLARNLRVSGEGKPILGILGAAVLHDDMLFLAHSGPVHTFVIGRGGVQHYYDSLGAGRGLGVSRTAAMRYYRCQLQPGDLTLISAYPPAGWSETALGGSASLSPDNLRRRLLTQAGDDLCFLMLRVIPGVGDLKITPFRSTEARVAVPLTSPEPIYASPTEEQEPGTVVPPQVETAGATETEHKGVYLSGKRLLAEEPKQQKKKSVLDRLRAIPTLFRKEKADKVSESTQAAIKVVPEVDEKAVTVDIPNISVSGTDQPWTPQSGAPDFQPGNVGSQPAVATAPRRVKKPGVLENQARGVLGWLLSGGRTFNQKSRDFFSRLTARILPGQADRLPAPSTGGMIFIAVAVPLVIVAIATTVYIQNGRGEQHRALVAQARQMAAQATIQTDNIMMRVNYEAAIEYLDQAAEYGNSEDMQVLRRQINQGLDNLEGIRRIAFRTVAPGGLAQEIKISSIVSSQTEDLYLLDQVSGRVTRLVFTRPGYELDSRFYCGPGQYGSLIVGPLVDIVAAPPGNKFDAAVVGVDAFGNLVYCSLDQRKNTAEVLIAPDAGWGNIQALHYFGNTLHILDPRSNAVWRYEGLNLEFFNPPRFFFGNDVPDMKDAVDIAIYQNDLFVVNTDGRLIYCTYSSVSSSPTRCSDPYPYRISQAGGEVQELTRLNVRFTNVQATQPPEPSLYFFDPEGPSVYQFSLGMNFIQQIRPAMDGEVTLPGTPATGFAVTSARRMVLAYNNQVYMGDLP